MQSLPAIQIDGEGHSNNGPDAFSAHELFESPQDESICLEFAWLQQRPRLRPTTMAAPMTSTGCSASATVKY
jgi:hypothetical protein